MLSADAAFQLMPPEAQGKNLSVQWEIAPGYYLYRGRMKFEAAEPASATLGNVTLPDGEKIHDEHFGEVEVYRTGTLTAQMRISQPLQKLKVTYQGCAEIGVCLPPQTRIVEVFNQP